RGTTQGPTFYRSDAETPDLQSTLLPACLAQAGNIATHGGFAQLVAAEAELAVHATRTTAQGAAGDLARGRRVARKLLQLGRGFELFLVAGGLAADDLLQRFTLLGVLLGQLRALGLAIDHGRLCHV